MTMWQFSWLPSTTPIQRNSSKRPFDLRMAVATTGVCLQPRQGIFRGEDCAFTAHFTLMSHPSIERTAGLQPSACGSFRFADSGRALIAGAWWLLLCSRTRAAVYPGRLRNVFRTPAGNIGEALRATAGKRVVGSSLAVHLGNPLKIMILRISGYGCHGRHRATC